MDNVLDNLEIVNQLFEKKHFKKALKLLSNLKEKFPDEKKIDISLAILYRETHEYKKSIIHISNCINSEAPKDFVENFISDVFLKILNLTFDPVKIKIYLELLNNLIKKNLNNLQLIFYRSQFFYRLNKFKRALHDLEFCRENEVNEDKLIAINWNLSLIYLKIGQIKKGYEFYEARFKVAFLKSNYEGYKNVYWEKHTNLADKKIFVYFEQGYGDTIQYVRFLNDLVLRKAKIFFLCQKSLFSLIQNSFPKVTLVRDFSNKYDYVIPLLSLPKLLDYDNFFKLSSAKYLKAESQSRLKLNYKANNNKINIGLCWKGNPKHQNDINRSFDIKILQNILKDQRFVFHSLMNTHSDDELIFISNNSNLLNHSNNLIDFNYTASLINTLDGVISVDTSIAHLAGALGVNTKLILPIINSDFRWHLRSTKSCWYKSIKIYRQSPYKPLNNILNEALLDFI